MAKKAQKTVNGDRWAEQSVIVKKTHPEAVSSRAAEAVAERHAQKKAYKKLQGDRSYRFITRPKECFLSFRGQRRGPHVTVYWGKLKPGARRTKACM